MAQEKNHESGMTIGLAGKAKGSKMSRRERNSIEKRDAHKKDVVRLCQCQSFAGTTAFRFCETRTETKHLMAQSSLFAFYSRSVPGRTGLMNENRYHLLSFFMY